MKYIRIPYISILAILLLASCSESLDINTNPLVASSADPNVILPYVFVQYSARHVTELGTRTMDVPQHMAACFNSPRQGATSSFLTGNTWFMYYNQVLGNLQLVEQDAEAAGPSSNNINAIAKIFKAKAFFELSCIWEEIPFSEALDGAAFPSPQFDAQQDVFAGCVDILDEAMQLIDDIPEGIVDVSVGDLIYGGNMDNWRRWANSLKIRILMMMRNNDPSADAQLVAALNDPVIESNDQSAMIRYLDTPAEANAWQRLIEAFFGGTAESSGVYAPSATLYNLLVDSGDPRADVLLFEADGSDGPPPIGMFTFPSPTSFALISNAAIRNDLPHIMFTPAEINFYRAELAMAGVTSEDVQSNFDSGLRNILSFWGGDIPGATVAITPEAIDDYISGYGAPTMEDIHEELYLESFLRPIIAWNTVRRTGVPSLEEVPGSTINGILKRFNYPPDEVAANLNTPANLPTDTPHWFEN